MKLSIVAGATSQTVNIFVRDSSSTTGGGLTGLVFNSAGLTAYYALPKAAAVSITLATLAAITTAWSSGGFKEVDATNMPGWYRLDIPNAALASGRFVSVHLKGATNMAPLPIEIQLTGWDNQDAVRGGLTALPNAAAGAVGGLPLSVDTSGRVDVLKINGTSQTARDLGASVLLSPGTGTGQLSLASGLVTLAAVTHTGARIPNVTLADTVTTYTGNTLQTGDNYARLGAPAGASHAADVAAVKADTAAVKVKTDNLPAAPAAVGDIPTALQNAAAMLDLSGGIETGLTPRQALRLIAAALAGKLSGAATTTITIRNAVADSKARITATVDSDGNRSAITTDVT